MKKGLIIGVSIILIGGCATSKVDYSAPNDEPIQNSIVIDAAFDVVWDRLVKELASDFFVINNIEKSSRIINVSFSSNSPEDFVSCGKTLREFSNARGTQKYEYDPASSIKYIVTDTKGTVFYADRVSRLTGRANIYVAPKDSSSTTVSVNVKYVVDVNQALTDVFGKPAGNQQFTFDISTKQSFLNSDGVKCIAKGKIEEKILNYAK